MTAKEYLSQIETLDTVINQKLQELDNLHELATSIGSFDYSKDRVQTSPSLEAPFARITEKAAELDAEINTLIDERLDRIGRIQSLDDRRYMQVLYKRYAEYKTFNVIAKEMNYYISTVYRLHNEALERLEKNESK